MKASTIERLMRKEKQFKGVFPSDKIKLKEGGAIVNTDSSKEPGSHWIGLYARGEILEYFDSYGLGPLMPDIIKFTKKFKQVIFNSVQVQDIESTLCGEYCIFFLKKRFKGESLSQIINELIKIRSINKASSLK